VDVETLAAMSETIQRGTPTVGAAHVASAGCVASPSPAAAFGHVRCTRSWRTRGEEVVMRAITLEDGSDANADDTIPPSERVENFLACVETGQRRSARFRIAAAAVGLLVATVATLTSTGLITPDTTTLLTSFLARQ
jgi:hypothetical protein